MHAFAETGEARMKQIGILWSAVLAAAWWCAGPARRCAGDEVKLKNGSALRGDVLKEKAKTVVFDLGFAILQIPRSEVASIVRGNSAAGKGEARRIRVRRSGAPRLYSMADLPLSTVADCVKRFDEAVVLIASPGGLGSGFIIREDGYVVTNFHVIEGETRITVTVFQKMPRGFRRRKFEQVRIVALNPFLDLALLKIEELKGEKLKKVYLGDFARLRVGERVFAIGNPLGLERSVSEGIVSTKTRNFGGLLYIQTTAAINPGNSGGPLFNLRGEVVGVTNMKIPFVAEGLGFAIPVSYVKEFLDNRSAFAYDKDSPSSGYRYLKPPRKPKRGAPK